MQHSIKICLTSRISAEKFQTLLNGRIKKVKIDLRANGKLFNHGRF